MISSAATKAVIARSMEQMRTAKERAIGLLKYSIAPENYGAIFTLPFCGIFPLVHTFGMKFEIDILFCDSQKKISHLYRGVKPGRFILPLTKILGGCAYLVEFSKCDLSHLKIGDQLEWPESGGRV